MSKRNKQANADSLYQLMMMHPSIELEWEFVNASSDGWVTFKQKDRSFRARESFDESSYRCVDFESNGEQFRFYSIADLVRELNGLYSYVRVNEHHE